MLDVADDSEHSFSEFPDQLMDSQQRSSEICVMYKWDNNRSMVYNML